MQQDLRRGLKLYMSNNMESLGDICAILMSEYPLSSPFAHEKVVVMNLGMKTFVSQRIALQNGIHALCDFYQIWQLIFETHKLLNKSKSQQIVSLNLYDREHLTWNIFTQMGLWAAQAACAQTEEGSENTERSKVEPIYARLLQYLEDDRYGDKAYELAAKIADTLDTYQMYRPHWIKAWNKIPLSAFDAYERNPNDQDNPVNQFIERECTRFVREKSGFNAARKDSGSLGEGTGEGENLPNLSVEVDAERLKASLEDDTEAQRVSAERVGRVRALFKHNVWQIKLWCLLRYNYSFTNDKGIPYRDWAPAEFDWLLRNLDRSQVMNNLIDKLEALAPKQDETTGALIAPTYDEFNPAISAVFADRAEFNNNKEALLGLYERIFVFGVSAMPPIVVKFLNALARHCNINVMLLNPCQEYWADIRAKSREEFEDYVKVIQGSSISAHDLKLERPKLLAPGVDAKGHATHGKKSKESASKLRQEVNYLPLSLKALVPNAYDASGERVEGHPLLLSYGKQGRDNLYLFYQHEPVPVNIACFSEPDLPDGGDFKTKSIKRHDRQITEVRGGTLLTFLQHQLLNLEQPNERYIIAPHDVSLSVHACHTKRREVEVLHDAILACFNRAKMEGRTLYPRDIVVMVPTINDYAPHITAVFGGQYEKSDPNYIPFVISDRTESEANTVAQSLMKLLEIGSVRITSVLVAELLAEDAIARRFGLNREQVEVIVRWLQATNIYWGLDANDVSPLAEIVIPGTFALGMERMILGALMGETDLPCWSEIEGSDTIILGKFWDFLQALRELRSRFTPELALTPAEWSRELNNMLTERFFDESTETLQALKGIEKVIDDLKVTIEHLSHKPRINLPVFAAALRQGLTAQRNFQPFLRDKVNFCSLVPMRAVPFKHIFILGLNDIDFPREEKAPSFNLIASKELYARGDRSRGIDDRFLFLEALISARESIYFSYIGQSPNDKSALNPSIVLSELIFFLGDSCAVEGLEDIKESERPDSVKARLCVSERLNAYDEINFHAAHYANALPLSAEDEANTIAAYRSRIEQDESAQGAAWSQYRRALQCEREQVPSFKRSFILLNSKTLKKPREILGAGVFKPDMQAMTHQLVELDRLHDFMCDPSKTFMRNVLEIRLDQVQDDTLVADESFDLERYQLDRLVSELIALPASERSAYLKRQADLGSLPYGLFFEQLKETVQLQVEALSATLQQEFGLEHSALIAERPCPNTIWQLTLPRSFFSEVTELDLGAIGSDVAKMQLEPEFVPSWLQDLSEDEVYHFELTLQSSCHQRAIVLTLLNNLSTALDKSLCDCHGEPLNLIGAANKPKVVYAALKEAIGQYCYDGGLRDVAVVDRNGQIFKFRALSAQTMRTVINTWLVCYLIGQSRPLPIAPSIITNLNYSKQGEPQYTPDISYDSYSSYLFASMSDLERYDELYLSAWAFHDFYLNTLAPNFVLGAAS